MPPAAPTSRETIEAEQLRLLRRLLGELVPGNRFYAPRIEAAGLSEDLSDIEAFTERMPLTTKADLVEDQRRCPPYGTNLTYPIEQYTRYNQTSATTGTPLRWLDTPESWQGLLDNWKQVFAAAGVGAADRVMFTFSFGPFLGFWTAFEAATQVGCLCLPGGGLGSPARLRMILDNRATALCCTPTYALRLAEVAQEQRIDLADSAVKVIIVAGESGGSVPATRERISRGWGGARVFDHHGMTEVGPATFENPDHPGTLHVIEPAYLAEVLDPDMLVPAKPGQTGELVLTTLSRAASPLLRYRTGDLVRLSAEPPERLGRPETALDGGILSRVDDMVVVRGVNVFPSAVDQIVRANSDVAEYRVEIDTEDAMTRMTLIVEPIPERAGKVSLATDLRERLRGALSLRVPVKLAEPGTLPRFEMKAKRWIREND